MALSEPQLQLCSTLADDGTLTLSLESKPPGPLGDNEVWVAVQAAPINPSDLGLLLAGADLSTAKSEGEGRAEGDRHRSRCRPPPLCRASQAHPPRGQ